MAYRQRVGSTTYVFPDLKSLMAKASPLRSGDRLAGVAAATAEENVAAKLALAELTVAEIIAAPLIPYDEDEVTRLILDGHDARSCASIAGMSLGALRDHLLSEFCDAATLAALAPGVTPEVAAAVSKLMRNQDLIAVARKCEVVTRFRDTIGLRGTLAVRLQPNHPTDDRAGVMAAVLDGLMYGAGDAVIGVNPASDSAASIGELLRILDALIARYDIPTQSCVLTHVTQSLALIEAGAPVDLIFQSMAGTQAANASFGVDLALLREAQDAGRAQKRGTIGDNVMYFETGQGSALSANAHHGVDQQTLEARAYAVARAFAPLLVNTVVGFIGPEYLYDGKEIIRAGLEDHFCGKLMGLPLGCDVCCTSHAEADQDDMDTLLTLLGVAGVSYIMGVPGGDDVMLGYQSSSFHDALYLRDVLRLKRAPEFEAWLARMGLVDETGRLVAPGATHPLLALLPGAA